MPLKLFDQVVTRYITDNTLGSAGMAPTGAQGGGGYGTSDTYAPGDSRLPKALGAKIVRRKKKKKKKKVNESLNEKHSIGTKDNPVILPEEEIVVLQADNDEHKRGLLVKWKEEGGYDVAYWFGDPTQVVPAELKGDGKSFGNIKNVYLGFHPELDDPSMKDYRDSLKKK